MYLKGRSVPWRGSQRRSNPWRMILWLALILGTLWVYSLFDQGTIQTPFEPTPLPTRNPLSWAEEARAQFAAGEFDLAILAYRRALEIDTQNVDYWVGRARVELFAERDAEALKSAQDAVLLAPESAKARAILAWALRENDRPEEARAAAVQAIALDGNYAPAHAYYSLILNDALNTEQGFREAQLALQLDPTLLEAHIALGYSNEVVGNYEGAIMRYKDALALNPNIIETYRKIALNYRALKDFEQAILYFGKANSVDPNNVIPYLDLSRTFIQIDQLGTAEQYLNSALELEPWNPNIHGRLGVLYFKRKNYESAKPALLLAIEGGEYEISDTERVTVEPMPLDARSLEYYYTLGNLMAFYRECGPNEAPYYLSRALSFAPDDATVVGSYEESMAICRDFLAGAAGPSGETPAPTAQP